LLEKGEIHLVLLEERFFAARQFKENSDEVALLLLDVREQQT